MVWVGEREGSREGGRGYAWEEGKEKGAVGVHDMGMVCGVVASLAGWMIELRWRVFIHSCVCVCVCGRVRVRVRTADPPADPSGVRTLESHVKRLIRRFGP